MHFVEPTNRCPSANESKADILSHLGLLLVLAITALACIRIVSTYNVFSQTWDEPAHVACGLEWLDHGTYTYEELHPPVARVAVALGPYLAGIRLSGRYPNPDQMWAEGNEIFWTRGEYVRNLALARLGTLPFFVLLALTLWYWTRSLYGDAAAVVAVLLLASLPPVLAHSGLATTDIPFTAMFTVALFAFTRWLENPSRRRAIYMTVSAALAATTKFSALVFLPACMVPLIILRVWAEQGVISEWRRNAGKHLKSLVLGLGIACLLIWGVYRFSLRPMTGPEHRPHQTIDHFLGKAGRLHDMAEVLAEKTPIPAPEFFLGMNRVRDVVTKGRKGFLLGEVRATGWWYFFPVALAVKTPIAFLILVALGSFVIARKWKSSRAWPALLPGVTAVTLLLVCLPTEFNIGLRHILPIYPFLAMIAALAVVHLWNAHRMRLLSNSVAIGLVAWQLVTTARAHPDYLASFNEFAAGHPERVLVDSDLDFGQDLLRLVAKLDELHVNELAISYSGSADLTRHGLPPYRRLVPFEHTTGWVAISLYMLKTGGKDAPPDAFAWLEAYQPAALVGNSIRLYYIAD